jgi:transposase
MTRRRKGPLRPLTDDERQHLTRLRRATPAPAVRVARAVMPLAVAGGADCRGAAQAAGRTRGDAVSHLVARFNREGVAAPAPRHGGGRAPAYDAAAGARILREVARTPTPDADGAAAWSLTTLRRAPRAAPDGLPAVSAFTIRRVLREAGLTFQRARPWRPTGPAVRRREAGAVTVTDPDAGPKKSRSGGPTRSARRSARPCGVRTRPARSGRPRTPARPGSRRADRPAGPTSTSAAARPKSRPRSARPTGGCGPEA